MIYLDNTFLCSALSSAQYLGVSFNWMVLDGADGGHPGRPEIQMNPCWPPSELIEN